MRSFDSFENKSVLYMKDYKEYSIILGEIMTRYIFSSVNNGINKKNGVNTVDEFYDNAKIRSFVDYEKSNLNTDKVVFNSFSKINNNFKYWLIFLFLIGYMFDKNSNYETIFNYNMLKKHIEKLLKKKSKNSDKKNKKKTPPDFSA